MTNQPTEDADMSTSTTMKAPLSLEDGEIDWLIMMTINDPAENEDYARHNASMLCTKEEQKQVENLLTDIRTNYVKISEILAKYRG